MLWEKILDKLPSTINGWPISDFEECSYYEAEYVLGKDGKIYFAEMGNFIVAFRKKAKP